MAWPMDDLAAILEQPLKDLQFTLGVLETLMK